jgi:phosphoesterase RecJ-like protein
MTTSTSATQPTSQYESNLDLAAAAKLIREASSVVVITHAKPDGDAIGCVIAVVAAVNQLGIPVEGVVVPPVPGSLLTLVEDQPVRSLDEGQSLPDADLYVVVDTGAYSQIGPARAVIDAHLDRTLILDHHLSGDIPAAHRHIEGDAAACAEVIAVLLDYLADKPGLEGPDRRTAPIGTRATDWQNPLYSHTVRKALFAGIASDTGWFRFSNTRPRTHELAARLIRLGVDHADLYAQLEQTERPEKLQLMIRALDSLELLADGRVAIMTLRARDFIETGAQIEETERFVDVPQIVATVQVVVLITEPPPFSGNGSPVVTAERLDSSSISSVQTRLSFRSKPGPGAVNVARLAEAFGGGGHARAAGAKVDAPVSVVLARVHEAVKAFFR